jgi:hypothetical protein
MTTLLHIWQVLDAELDPETVLIKRFSVFFPIFLLGGTGTASVMLIQYLIC